MLNIDKLAEYIEPKIWDAWPKPWYATLYSVIEPIHLKFQLKKYNKNCYSYRLYDAHDNCLIRGVTIHGLAAYLSPFVLRAFRERKNSRPSCSLTGYSIGKRCTYDKLRNNTP